jgi:hypothetical protein
MTPDQINESVWEYIKPAENALIPENSDGYNEYEVYRAWNAGYQTAYKEYQEDADKWREYKNAMLLMQTKINPSDYIVRNSDGE